MEELVIRPTVKFIRLGYLVVAALILGVVVAQNRLADSLPPDLPRGLLRVRRGLIPSTHASSPCCGDPPVRRLPP